MNGCVWPCCCECCVVVTADLCLAVIVCVHNCGLTLAANAVVSSIVFTVCVSLLMICVITLCLFFLATAQYEMDMT